MTDNTGNVKNAREFMMENTYSAVASQDHAHVADRLMEDIGEIPWISETLDAIVSVSVYVRRFRKLKERVNELIQLHSIRLKSTGSSSATFPLTDELFRAQIGVEPGEHDSRKVSRPEALLNLAEEGYSDLQSVVNSLTNEGTSDTNDNESSGGGLTAAGHYAPELRGRPK